MLQDKIATFVGNVQDINGVPAPVREKTEDETIYKHMLAVTKAIGQVL